MAIRLVLSIAGSAGLVFGTSAAAQTSGAPAGNPASRTATASSASPAPQPLARASFLAAMDAEYRNYDADKDGAVTRSELESAEKRKMAAAAAQRMQAQFARIDLNRDGQLSYDEFSRAMSAAQANPDVSPLLAGFDMNKDGKITLIEYRTVTLANFDRLDTDKDGVASIAELRAGNIVK